MTLRLEFDVQYLSFPLSRNEAVDMNWTTKVGGEKISIFSVCTNWKTETYRQAIRSRLQTGTKRNLNADVPFRLITLIEGFRQVPVHHTCNRDAETESQLPRYYGLNLS